MIEKIAELLGVLPDTVKGDIGLYIGAGLTVLVFVVALIVGLVTKGDFGKFASLARSIVKNGASGVNAGMQKMPIKIKKQYKRAMTTGAKPSDIVSVDAAVGAPFSRTALSKMPIATAVGAVVGICAGVGISAVNTGEFGKAEGIIVAVTALVGGLLMLVAAIVASAAYKGAMKAYEELMDVLDSSARSGGESHEDRAEQTFSEQETPAFESYAQQPAYEQAQPAYEHADTVYEQQAYESPVYEQTEYAGAQAEPEPQFTAQESEEAREQALAAEKAEQEERERKEAEKAAAAQKRLEELRAQREAQLKARRQAQAQQSASAAASGSPEDVIARIDRIETEGAPLSTMKEVAVLLQKERAKPENKTPEQQKKLNEALSKLLKAMSAAQKK